METDLEQLKELSIILFFLVFTIVFGDLTCVLSFSQAHQDPYHDVSVLFARHVQNVQFSFTHRYVIAMERAGPIAWRFTGTLIALKPSQKTVHVSLDLLFEK